MWFPGGACMAAGGVCVAAGGVCVVSGGHVWLPGGACVDAGGVHAWGGMCGCRGACMAAVGGMHGCQGGVCGCRGMCVAAGGACMAARGGMCGCQGGAWLPGGMRGCGGVHGHWGGGAACMVAGGVPCDLSHHAFDVTCMLSPHQLRASSYTPAYILVGHVTRMPPPPWTDRHL